VLISHAHGDHDQAAALLQSRYRAKIVMGRDSQRKTAKAAAAAGATVVMTNHTEFDRAYDRVRIVQLPRTAGEKHPYEADAATVQRYFEMGADCAEAQRLSMP
jgi:metallo-beta-lactamase class B